MKKSILFLAVASVFALASCGEKAPEVVEAPVDSVAAVVDSAAAVVDSAAAVVDSAAAATTTEAAPAEAAH